MKINFPVLALAVGAFTIGTTEFSPMGFLPEIARNLEISIPVPVCWSVPKNALKMSLIKKSA